MKKHNYNAPLIPDHEVMRKIGGGSYGEVWMARSITDVMRAVKVVWRENFDDQRDFEREFEGIRNYEPISRSHPSLIPILHVGRSNEEREFYYYIMELGDDVLSGQDINPVTYEPRNLRTDLKAADNTPLDIDFCLEVGMKIADGLAFLHERELAHRDIKPANIIYLHGNPKLADIGLVALPGQRTFVGTEGFVPPEGPGTRQADVYSLGKVLYEMATGMDRLDFPSIPDHQFQGDKATRWQNLNRVICDTCENNEPDRKIKSAFVLSEQLNRISAGKKPQTKSRIDLKIKAFSVLTLLIFACIIALTRLQSANQNSDDSPQYAPVKIVSSPIGAEVWSFDGEFLGTTPLASRDEQIGTIVEFEFRLAGYRNTIARKKVVKGGTILEAILPVFAPPKVGEPWSDAIGMVYRPENETHVTVDLISHSFFQRFVKEHGEANHSNAFIRKNNEELKIEVTNLKHARNFCHWLTNVSQKNGYLTEDYIIEPVLDHSTKLFQYDDRSKTQNFRPFRCRVRKILYASLTITSKPAHGAVVYLQGEPVGYTSLKDETITLGKLHPGAHEIIIEAEGYKTQKRVIQLNPSEQKEVKFTLMPNNSVVFDRQWKNSLGMQLAPIHERLMVSIWETRIQDYHRYLSAKSKSVLQKARFAQEKSHPVVNVTVEQAEAFCVWLTQKERKEFRIGEQQEYRLPTDQEWSLFCGIREEEGETPFLRDMAQLNGFPWGSQWPPPTMAGNFADSSASSTLETDSTRAISMYEDGFSYTAPVGVSQANRLGIYDLSGNVYEWVSDDFGIDEYGVTRGGSWKSYQKENLKTTFRYPVKKDAVNDDVGFRIVLSKITQE